MEGPKRLRKKEWMIILIFLLLCSAAYGLIHFRGQSTGLVAEIYHNQTLERTIDLDRAINETITLDAEGKVHIEVLDHRVRFVDVDCPDKICEHAGFLGKEGDIAVCMPNRYYMVVVSTS